MLYCARKQEKHISQTYFKEETNMSILVTGGAGFIGSHTCVELLNAGYDVVVVDNLYNASEKALDRVKEITGKDLKFYKADIRDREAMNEVFEKEEIESVIHFAGLKAVGESVQKPLEYYRRNDHTLRRYEKPRREEYHLQLFRNGIRRPGIYPDHRGVPEGNLHKPVRMDKMDAGADPD